jgi:anaerobic selenocysteine-containing dehydrogenase
VSPYPSAFFDEVSAVAYGGIPFGVVGDQAELPAATAGAPQPSLQQSVTKSKGLRLVRYRPLFSGPAVERTPELRFQRPLAEVELSADDATRRQIRPGDDVTVSSNGTSVRLRARISEDVRAGVVRIAEEHAGDLQPDVELSK